jgi:hypothetical protein
LAASLYYSRRRWKERCRRLRQQFGRAAKEIIALKERVEWLEARLEAAEAAHATEQQDTEPPVERCAEESPLPFHSFSASMISLCVNLAKRIGLRASEDVLQVVFDWLGQSRVIPDWTTIRGWCQLRFSRSVSGHRTSRGRSFPAGSFVLPLQKELVRNPAGRPFAKRRPIPPRFRDTVKQIKGMNQICSGTIGGHSTT